MKRLFCVLAAGLLLTSACSGPAALKSSDASGSAGKKQAAEASKYDRLASERNKEIKREPLELTGYSETIGASLSKPQYKQFAVNGSFTIEGKIDSPEQLKGEYAWIKVNSKDPFDTKTALEYYTPIKNGKVKQHIQLYNGEGAYSVSVLIPDNNRENYYSELASFEAINVNPEKKRDLTLTPFGFESELSLAKPLAGYITANESMRLEGKLKRNDVYETLMIQIKKDGQHWQHVLPVKDGTFSFNVPLFYGKGIHEIELLVPDKNAENRYQYAAKLFADNQSERTMEPITYYRGYDERGLQLAQPEFGGDKAELVYQIKGTIDPEADHASETTHLYIKTRKGQDEALDVIPVRNYSFDSPFYLRFGPGEYQVSINVPEIRTGNSSTFRFTSVAEFKVENTASEDNRDLLPSRGIQSDNPDIIALAHEITKNKSTDMEKAKAIYEYTARNVVYDVNKLNNNDFAWDDSALKTLDRKSGVCQDYAYLAAALLRASGIEARFVTGTAIAGFWPENHAWIEARVNGKWISLDPTWGSGYVEKNKFVRKYTEAYFNPSPEEFKKTHVRIGVEY